MAKEETTKAKSARELVTFGPLPQGDTRKCARRNADYTCTATPTQAAFSKATNPSKSIKEWNIACCSDEACMESAACIALAWVGRADEIKHLLKS